MSIPSPIPPAELERLVLDAIAGIRFGAVEVTIHDGRIVQIEKREKVRAEPAPFAHAQRKSST